jgi:integrase
MQRKRDQSGTTVRIGDYWCVRYADWRIEDGVRIRKQGLTHKLTVVLEEHKRLKRPPAYVEKLQAEFMETVNATTARPEMCSTIGQFVESNWLPFIREQRSSSTVTTYNFYWKHMLKPYLGKQLVRDYTTEQAERMLHEIGRHHPTIKRATLHKLRSILSGIFKRAIGQGLRPGHNPIREVTPPKGLPSEETYAYNLQEIRQMLGAIPHEMTRVIVALAGYVGLSKSEIQGLTWEAYDGAAGEIKVISGVVNGVRGDLKTKARKASVPLIPSVLALLDLYRLRLGNPTTGVMFASRVLASENAGATVIATPVCLHNLFTRQIDPILNACGECSKIRKKHDTDGKADHEYVRRSDLPEWHGWHALRRGLGSNLNELGVADLTIQRILRHSNVTTTRKSYIKIREDNVTAGMAQLEAGIRRTETAQLEAENHKAERPN